MSNTYILIPAHNKESLPIFLKELEKYSFNKIVVLQKEDEITINSISNFKDISICYKKIMDMEML